MIAQTGVPDVDGLWDALMVWVGGVLILLFAMALIWLAVIARIVHRATLGQDAQTMAALRALPLPVAIALDGIDLALDFVGAPIAWLVITRAAEYYDAPALKRLRGLTLIESLLPGTQLVPVMTLAWVYARSRDGASMGSDARAPDVIEGTARPVPPRDEEPP